MSIAAQRSTTSKPVRTLIGDVALILRSDRPGTLRIGVAGENRSLTLSVLATDARRWADSASRLLAPERRRRAPRAKADTARRWRAVLEEPGVGAGTFVLLRIDSAGTRRFLLFADDATLDGIRAPLEPEEATLLIRLVRGAVAPARSSAPKKKGGGAAPRASTPARPPATKGGAKPALRTQGEGTPRNQPRQPSIDVSWSLPDASVGNPDHGR